ncbi:uncharacterized protein [Branchiostoma lanceolatum]|uniref:uncharacterized protein n=1 Tax=Branchiostoma lanceolatum TaxID=7740 RepID=UPI0034563D8C
MRPDKLGSLPLVFLVGVAILTVVCTGQPRFTQVPGTLIATTGEDVVFNWEFTEGIEVLFIHWIYSNVDTIMYDRGDLKVQSRYESRIERVGQAGFKLRNVAVSDAGTYRVEVLFLGAASLEDTATLEIRYPPTGTLISTQSNGEKEEGAVFKEGTTMQLTCKTKSHPPSQYSWSKPASSLSPSVIVNATSGVFTMTNVLKNDTGLYQCRAFNGIQPDGIASINVTIQYPPAMTTAFFVSPRGGNVIEGDEVRIGCRVGDALPRPNFRWKRSSKTADLPKSAIVDERTGVLVIPSVQLTEAGVYDCIADNGVEPVGYAFIQLNVTAEPEVGPVGNRTRRSSELVIPLSTSSGGFFLLGFTFGVIMYMHRRAKRREANQLQNDPTINEHPRQDDPLLYLRPDTSVMRMAMATEKEKTVDPILQEFWGYLVKMDADPVLVYFQEKKVLSADHTAVIRKAPSVVDKLLKEICVLEGEKSPQLLSEALRYTDQNHLADLLDGKTLPDVKGLSVVDASDSSFSIQFKRAFTNIQHFGDVDKYVVTLEVAVQEPETMATRCLNATDQLQAEFTNLASGTSYNVTVVSMKGETRSAGVTVTVTTIGGYEEPSGLLATFNEEERSQINHVLIYKDKITLTEPLGKGNFGEVRYGVYVTQDRCVPCAVKTLFGKSLPT